MYFLALAADYDGTIAEHGVVDAQTVEAFNKFKKSGRKVILVTGRDLPDLLRVFPQIELFDRVVAENGALLFNPTTKEEKAFGEAPSPHFVRYLQDRKVTPLAVGKSIVATWEPNETIVLEAIRELGLEAQIIFNKGAVMVLPSGVNKATGLKAALDELELSSHNVVGVGDAENDHAFLRSCGCAAAVGNALPIIKESADVRLEGERGAGVIELIGIINANEAAMIPSDRHGLIIGKQNGTDIRIDPHRGASLIAGSSGIGKSTLAKALTEAMADAHFEFCVFDPEGDYSELEHAITVGNAETPPKVEEILTLIRKLGSNVVVSAQALRPGERPDFFAKLLPQIASLRAQTGRPHWLVIDEAHHLLPVARKDVAEFMPEEMSAAIFITVHPEAVSPEALKTVTTVVALGSKANETVAAFSEAIGIKPPPEAHPPGDDQILIWNRDEEFTPQLITPVRPRQAHRRHTKKYAEGELGEDLSFYFRGPKGALKLRAQNLMLFLQIAEGVDDGTWEHHLRRNDYSEWLQRVIKNDELAREVGEVENDQGLSPLDSRRLIAEAITRRYTAPAKETKA